MDGCIEEKINEIKKAKLPTKEQKPDTKVVKDAVLQDDCGIFLAWSFHGGSSPYQGIAKYWYHTGCRPVSYDQYISTKNCDVPNLE